MNLADELSRYHAAAAIFGSGTIQTETPRQRSDCVRIVVLCQGNDVAIGVDQDCHPAVRQPVAVTEPQIVKGNTQAAFVCAAS